MIDVNMQMEQILPPGRTTATAGNEGTNRGGAPSKTEEPAENVSESETRAPLDQKSLQETLKDMNVSLQRLRSELQFSVDEASGRTVIKLVNAETDEVIRQIPSEELLQLQERLGRLEEVIFSDYA